MGEAVLNNFVFTEFPFKTVSGDVTAFHIIIVISVFFMTFIGAVTSGNMSEAALKQKLATRTAHLGQMTKLFNKAQQLIERRRRN